MPAYRSDAEAEIRERVVDHLRRIRPNGPRDELIAELVAGKDELRRLLNVIWRAEYKPDAPHWQPLDDLPGMVSQMDNMFAGVRNQRDATLAKAHSTREPG